MSQVQEHPMAATRRNDVSVKIDAKAAEIARKAASLKEKTLAEYLTDVVLSAASRDLMSEAKRSARSDPKPDPKD